MFRKSLAISTVALCALVAGSVSNTFAQPKIGEAPIRPDNFEVGNPTYGFLEAPPTSKFVSPYRLEITFTTTDPTPPAMVYYGLNTLDEELNYPRFRRSAAEETNVLSKEHRIEIDVSSLLEYMPNTEYEPRVVWRAELFLQNKLSTRFVEGRAYFDPETIGYATTLLFGPTVEKLGEKEVTIAFDLDEAADATVTVTNYRGEKIGDFESASKLRHEVAIDGLNPNTEYNYYVTAGNTTTREYSFTTTDRTKPFEFAAMVDSREGVGGGMRNFAGVNGFSLYTLGSDAYFKGADFVLFAGDLINGYTSSVGDFRVQLNAFRQIFEPLHSRIPIYEAMGNHEALIDNFQDGSRYGLSFDKQTPNSAEDIFADSFVNPTNGPENEAKGGPTYEENVYYFDHGNSRFFVLNNNYWWVSDPHNYGGNLEGYILPNQVEWLREQVEIANEVDHIENLFYAAQEPPFPNGGHTQDAMWYNGGDTNRNGVINEEDIDIVENRNEVWEIIASSPKSVAFIAGDEHAYSRALIAPATDVGHKRKSDGTEAVFKYPIWQVTAGGAGAPWYDKELDLPWTPYLKAHSTQPHYAFFKVDGKDVDLEVYAQTGQLIDEATLSRTEQVLDR